MSIRYLILELSTELKQDTPRPIIWSHDWVDIKEVEREREKIIKKYHIEPENISIVQYRE